MTSTLSLNRICNLSRINFSNQCEQAGRHTHTHTHTHTFVHTFIKAPLQGTPPFLCSEFSGVHCINPTCCRYILQSRQSSFSSFGVLTWIKILNKCIPCWVAATFEILNEAAFYEFSKEFITKFLIMLAIANPFSWWYSNKDLATLLPPCPALFPFEVELLIRPSFLFL